jgi:hypothetical protein
MYETAKQIIASAKMMTICGHTCMRLCPSEIGLKIILSISDVKTGVRNR